MRPDLLRLRALLLARAADPAVQDWHAQHATVPHSPCDRCGTTLALAVEPCARCTFALCPPCYLKHLFRRARSRDSLCTAVVEWATFHAAIRQDRDEAMPTAEDFAAAREALRGYLR